MQRFAGTPRDEMAITLRINTVKASQSIVTQAFEYAKKHGYKTVTIVEKPNVLRETGGLVLRTARKVAQNYPGIELWETNIDAMCMWLVKNPQNYGVLVVFRENTEDMYVGIEFHPVPDEVVDGVSFCNRYR